MERVVINPPSLPRYLSFVLKRLARVVFGVVVLWLMLDAVGFRAGSLPQWLTLFGGLWIVVASLQTLLEPSLVIDADGIVVRRWYVSVLRVGRQRRLPRQPWQPMWKTLSGRGGRMRVVEIMLADSSGYAHPVRFFLVDLQDLERELADAGDPQRG